METGNFIKKKPSGYLNAKKRPMLQHELISIFYKKQPMYNPVPWNKGSEVLYMPNIKNNCTIQSGMRSFCKVNIISLVKSSFNMQYSNICKQTNGIFLTI